jgi:hypothetical protein
MAGTAWTLPQSGRHAVALTIERSQRLEHLVNRYGLRSSGRVQQGRRGFARAGIGHRRCENVSLFGDREVFVFG